MRMFSNNQIAAVVIILASILLAAGATWDAAQNSGNAWWYVSIGATLAIAAVLNARNAKQCSEGQVEAK